MERWEKRLTDGIVQGKPNPHHKYTRGYTSSINTGPPERMGTKSQDLRDFRDRDDVTAPERFLTLRGGGVSAAASLSISAGLRETVVPPGFLEEGLSTVSLVAAGRRRVLMGRFLTSLSMSMSSSSSSASSSFSSSSVSSPASASAFSLPLSLPMALPSASTVVMVEEADEEERARFELLPAAETAVEDPEENDGDRSRARRAEGREGAELTGAFLPAASLVRPRDVPVA